MAGVGRTPYLLQVSARVCSCQQPPRELGRARTLANALPRIEGYWNVYLAFFGDQQIWISFEVIDLRDGVVCWRNGRQLRKEEERYDISKISEAS